MAEVEHFFSNLSSIQSVKRSNLIISHMQTFGTLQNNYGQQLHKISIAAGKPTQHKHAHMHTPIEGGGINVGCADELLKDALWTTQLFELNGPNMETAGGPGLSVEEIEAEFEKISIQSVSSDDRDGLAASVPISEVYDLSLLDDYSCRKGCC